MLWDFNQPGMAFGVAARCLRWCALGLRLTSECSVWQAGGWLGFETGEGDVLRRGVGEHA